MTDPPVAVTTRVGPNGSSRSKHGALVQLACCIAAWLAVSWLVYPGFLGPFTPFHSDNYLGAESAAQPLLHELLKPRPLQYLVFRPVLIAGLRLSLIACALIAVIYAWMVVACFARVAKVRAGPLAFLACYALVFAHDSTRFSYSYDTTARLAGVFAVLAMNAFWSWLENRERWRLLGSIALFGVSLLSKETFILPMALFVAWTAAQRFRSARRVILLLLPFGALALEAVGLPALSGASMYVNPVAAAADPYFMTRDPRMISANLWSDASQVFLPVTLGLLPLAFWPRIDRAPRLAVTALFWAMALAGYLPHAMLVNHRLGYHIWQGLPFFFAFVIFIDFSFLHRRALAMAAVVLIGLSLYGYRAKAIKQDWWYELQQTINRNLLADLEQRADLLRGKKRTALIGFGVFFFHPWHHPRYINELLRYQGDWFLLSDQTGQEENVHYVKGLPDRGLDCALFVSRFDGHIVRLLEGQDLDRVLARLHADPATLAAVNLDARLVTTLIAK